MKGGKGACGPFVFPPNPPNASFQKQVVILLKHTGDAPPLKQSKFKLASSANFQKVMDFLRKQLHFKPDQPLVNVSPTFSLPALLCSVRLSFAQTQQQQQLLQYLFINQAFQPNPEEIVADLFKVLYPPPPSLPSF